MEWVGEGGYTLRCDKLTSRSLEISRNSSWLIRSLVVPLASGAVKTAFDFLPNTRRGGFLLLFKKDTLLSLSGNLSPLTWVRLQQPQEQRYTQSYKWMLTVPFNGTWPVVQMEMQNKVTTWNRAGGMWWLNG